MCTPAPRWSEGVRAPRWLQARSALARRSPAAAEEGRKNNIRKPPSSYRFFLPLLLSVRADWPTASEFAERTRASRRGEGRQGWEGECRSLGGQMVAAYGPVRGEINK